MFKCDILSSIFRAVPWLSGLNAGIKNAAKCCRIFRCDSPSRQFFFNAFEL